MATLALKLFLTPIFIALVTLAGRRWGPGVSGWLIGFPLTSGPISIILSFQFGLSFAARTAIGNLAGQASVCIFCLAFSLACQKFNWFFSALFATLAFVVSTFIWNRFTLALLPALALLLIVIGITYSFIPRRPVGNNIMVAPKWDLPARMVVATLFVYLLTTFAAHLGPQLSGLISPFPVFGTVLAVFTQKQLGADAAAKLLRSYVIGSLGYACFFLVVGGLLTHLGMIWTYGIAAISAVGLNGFSLSGAQHNAK